MTTTLSELHLAGLLKAMSTEGLHALLKSLDHTKMEPGTITAIRDEINRRRPPNPDAFKARLIERGREVVAAVACGTQLQLNARLAEKLVSGAWSPKPGDIFTFHGPNEGLAAAPDGARPVVLNREERALLRIALAEHLGEGDARTHLPDLSALTAKLEE